MLFDRSGSWQFNVGSTKTADGGLATTSIPQNQQFLYYAELALLPFLTFLVVMLLARHE
jgi:hypothetical protein